MSSQKLDYLFANKASSHFIRTPKLKYSASENPTEDDDLTNKRYVDNIHEIKNSLTIIDTEDSSETVISTTKSTSVGAAPVIIAATFDSTRFGNCVIHSDFALVGARSDGVSANICGNFRARCISGAWTMPATWYTSITVTTDAVFAGITSASLVPLQDPVTGTKLNLKLTGLAGETIYWSTTLVTTVRKLA